MAVSATRFDEADYSRQVARVKAAGLMCESHADKFVHFDRINRHDIDFVSTDFLAPDYRGQGRLLAEYARPTGSCSPHRPTRARSASARGRASSRNGSCPPYPSAPSTWNWKPKVAPGIELGGQTFTLDVPDKRTVTHQVLLHDAAPALRITALAGGITLTAIRGEGRSVRTITPHPARKREERDIPPNYARGPADRRASFAGTKYYRP